MQQESGRFKKVAAPLAQQLVAQLQDEHTREVVALYQEQCALRGELQRVVDLMTNEMIPREKVLHDMLDKMNSAMLETTQNLNAHHSKFSTAIGQSGQQGESQRKQLVDPLNEAEREVARLRQFLAQPPATVPDLPQNVMQQAQHWMPGSVAAAQAPRSPYGSSGPAPMARRPGSNGAAYY